MVRLLTAAIVLSVAGLAPAGDAAARKVKVALALHCQGKDCPKAKVSAALDAALPKSKERKVSESLRHIGVFMAPMPREKAPAAQCECCGPGCKCAPCDCLTYREAYDRAFRGERILFTADASDPSRPADVKPGRYEFWRDADGLHFRPFPEPKAARPVPIFRFAAPACRT